METETPEEALEGAHVRMRAGLASELLARVKAASPQFFERLVVELLLTMGYGGSRKDAGQAIGKSGDEGIDGVISEDRLGLDIVSVWILITLTTLARSSLRERLTNPRHPAHRTSILRDAWNRLGIRSGVPQG
jgi:restriction endonuclease Mrr